MKDTENVLICTLVFLGRGDACEFGVDLVVFGDLQHGRAVLDDPGQEVRPPRDLKDVLYVGQVICARQTQRRLTKL